MFKVSAEELQTTLKVLNQAIYAHNQWLVDLNRTLACRLPIDDHDVGADADHRCRFGQWLHEDPPQGLQGHPVFLAIGVKHARMHKFAGQSLRSLATDGLVDARIYDKLVDATDGLHLEIDALKRELEDSLHYRDALTGLGNRVSMLVELRRLHELVKRGVQQCGVAMMDLDHFKRVNDVHGHVIGDHLLVAVARYIMSALRPYDSVFRYGGEEFLLVLPTGDLQTARIVIDRIREGISDLVVEAASGETVSVTASFGIAQLHSNVNVEETIDRADQALFDAKARGRNQTRMADAIAA